MLRRLSAEDPMATRRKTGFDSYFDKRMKEPEFAAAYRSARAEIDAIDSLVRALDQARVEQGLSKSELARRIGARPELVRRLFTDKQANPTWKTVTSLAKELDCHLELVPNAPRRRSAEARAAV
jgi:ribosome-binding protein aMBF1 (putative translation factor)